MADEKRRWAMVLSCEHGGHGVPSHHRDLFAGRQPVLKSHRGWDRGALPLARRLARRLDAPLFATTVSRLLVDANRAETNPSVFSEITRLLPASQRARLVAQHHRPHREAVRQAVAEAIGRHGAVVHVSVHSFASVLDDVERRTDVGLLYDPDRSFERSVVTRWQAATRAALPEASVHRNAPYRGTSDGLTRWLRCCFEDACYAGIELELNQRWIGQTGASLRRALVEATATALLGLDE